LPSISYSIVLGYGSPPDKLQAVFHNYTQVDFILVLLYIIIIRLYSDQPYDAYYNRQSGNRSGLFYRPKPEYMLILCLPIGKPGYYIGEETEIQPIEEGIFAHCCFI